MSDTTTTNSVAGDTPAPEVDATIDADFDFNADVNDPEVAEATDDSPGQPAASGAKADPPSETIEIEFEGKKHAIPKALQPAFLMQADYTRKTQAVAEAARQLEQQRKDLDTSSKAQIDAVQAEIESHSKVYALRQQAAQWQNVNWELLEQNDRENGTNETTTALRRYNVLRDQLRDAETALQTKTTERQAKEQADQAAAAAQERADDENLIRQGYQELTSKIADWPTVARDVSTFGQTRFGFSPDEIAAVRDPRMFQVLHLAWLGAKSVQQQQTQQRVAQTQQVQPAPQVGGRAPPAARGAPRDTDTWMAWREKQLREKRGRR